MARPKELSAIVKLLGKLDPSVQRTFSAAASAAKGLDASIMRIAGTAAAVGVAAATAFTGIAVKLGTDCVRAAADFEKQMSNVATLLDGDWKGRISELSDELIAVKRATKKPIGDLVNGAYNIISAFGDAPDSAKKVEIAAKAAAAGLAETSDAVNLFSAEMKAYGDTSAEFEQKLADQAFMVVKLGQTDFPSLAAAMPSVVPIARMMGMRIEEVNGYLATLTGVTGGASEVTTQLSAALTALLKPSKEMQKSIEALGFKDGQAMVKAKGLQASLLALRKTVKTDVEFGNLFGRKEGINFALAATGELADSVTTKTKAMFGAVGIADEAFKRSGDNLTSRINAIRNEFEATQLEIGAMFTPALKRLAEKALPHVQKILAQVTARLKTWGDAMKAWARSIDWSAVMQRVSEQMRSYANALESWCRSVDWTQAIARVRDALATFIQLAKSACSLIVRATAWVRENAQTLRELAGNLAKAYINIKILQVAFMAFGAVVSVVQGVATAVRALWFITMALGKAVHITKLAHIAWMGILGVVKAAIFALRGAVLVWKGVCVAATAVQWAWNAALTANPIGAIIVAVVALVAALVALWYYWDDICKWFSDSWDALAQGWNEMWDGMGKWCREVIDSIKSYFQPLIDMVGKLGDVFNSAKEGAVGAWNNVKSLAGFAHGGFTNGVSICGEAGTEAVISFNPADRKANQGYWLEAGRMLGMLGAPTETHTNITNVGGVTFSPIIKAGETVDRGNIIEQLRAAMPELIDMIESAISERNGHRYGAA